MVDLLDRLSLELVSGAKELVKELDTSVVDVRSLGRSDSAPCDPVEDADDVSDEAGPSKPPSSVRPSAPPPCGEEDDGGA